MKFTKNDLQNLIKEEIEKNVDIELKEQEDILTPARKQEKLIKSIGKPLFAGFTREEMIKKIQAFVIDISDLELKTLVNILRKEYDFLEY